MMFARNLKPGQAVKVTPEDGGEILHISQVCMSKPVDGNRTYLKIVQGSQSFAACVLQKDKQESCSVDLFLSAREGLQLTLEGGKNELSVIGYFEPEPESESEGEDGMAGFGEDSEEESEGVSDDETEGMSAPVVRVGPYAEIYFFLKMKGDLIHLKKAVSGFTEYAARAVYAHLMQDGRIEDLDAQEEDSKKKGKAPNKKAQALKALQAAAANDDEDDDEDDDEEGEEDGEGESGEESGENSEEEEGSDEEEEDESDSEPAAPPPQENKRKGQQQQQQQQQSNKKAKTQAGGASGSKGDEATYKNALMDFLKKNGPTPLASLGQKVKKPASLPKMAAFLKAHSNVFVVDGGKCSLK
ncbi:hypothetical protein Emag_001803 [Eimeria magna]